MPGPPCAVPKQHPERSSRSWIQLHALHVSNLSARLRDSKAYAGLVEIAVPATPCSSPSLTTTSTPTASTTALSRPRLMQTPTPLNASGLALPLPESPAQAPVSSMQTLNRYSICFVE